MMGGVVWMPKRGGGADGVGGGGGGEEGFGGDAAGVEAFAAHQGALDEGGAEAVEGAAAGGGQTCGAGADDNNVVPIRWHEMLWARRADER